MNERGSTRARNEFAQRAILERKSLAIRQERKRRSKCPEGNKRKRMGQRSQPKNRAQASRSKRKKKRESDLEANLERERLRGKPRVEQTTLIRLNTSNKIKKLEQEEK